MKKGVVQLKTAKDVERKDLRNYRPVQSFVRLVKSEVFDMSEPDNEGGLFRVVLYVDETIVAFHASRESIGDLCGKMFDLLAQSKENYENACRNGNDRKSNRKADGDVSSVVQAVKPNVEPVSVGRT